MFGPLSRVTCIYGPLPVDLPGEAAAAPEPPDGAGHVVRVGAADHAPGHHHRVCDVQGGRCVPPTTPEVNSWLLFTAVQ